MITTWDITGHILSGLHGREIKIFRAQVDDERILAVEVGEQGSDYSGPDITRASLESSLSAFNHGRRWSCKVGLPGIFKTGSSDWFYFRAIELSLQDTNHQENPQVIDITDSDHDEDEGEAHFQEDLRRALQASQELHQSQQSAHRIESNDTTSNRSTFLSERAKLEKERLERQKRLRPESVAGKKAQTDTIEDEEEPPAKRYRSTSTLRSNPPEPSKEPLFWDGELRQTAAIRAEPRKDGLATFRLTDILGKVWVNPSTFLAWIWRLQTSELALAIISSYSLDYSWIYSFFDPSVPVILVAQPESSGEASVKIVLPNWIRTTPFLHAGYGCQHMKVCFVHLPLEPGW